MKSCSIIANGINRCEQYKCNHMHKQGTEKRADELFSNFRMSLSAALNNFVRRAVREYYIPFEIRGEIPNEETKAEIEEVKKNENRSIYRKILCHRRRNDRGSADLTYRIKLTSLFKKYLKKLRNVDTTWIFSRRLFVYWQTERPCRRKIKIMYCQGEYSGCRVSHYVELATDL